MAAYAALASLKNIIHDIQHHHSPPISIHNQQLHSLTQTLSSLLQFLEASKSRVADGDEADPFEMRIADAAYAAEDVIETHLVDAIHITRTHRQQTSSVAFKSIIFHQDLQRVIKEMDLINQIAVEMETENAVVVHSHNVSTSAAPLTYSSSSSNVTVCSDAAEYVIQSHSVDNIHLTRTRTVAAKISRFFNCFRASRNSETDAAPLRSSSSSSNVMVRYDDAVLISVAEKLIGGRLDRQIIPIVGMGGIGKTTLALNIYESQTIKEKFDVRAWATISQNYNTREILCEVLAQATEENKEKLSERSEDKLGFELHKYLFGRRFLIVMDDMWSIDAWEKMQHYFPNNGNGSRILVTTRLSQLGSQLNPIYNHQMEFLDEDSSWDLFSEIVFGERSCPLELIKIGKKIVENCRGLPLSIVVVGGLLMKKPRTIECWESISDNLTSEVNLGNDKHCLRLLLLSYNHLPAHLKPCFLYMAIFEEDDEIRVSTIIKLWVSEGFLKPINEKNLEMIAMGFLKDLVDRNLILIDKRGCSGKIKSCKIHDLLRDLCLNESQKEGFHHIIGRSQGLNREPRRVVIPRNTSQKKVLESLKSLQFVRSVICENGKVPDHQNLGLLRTFHAYKYRTIEDQRFMNSIAIQYVNLRHLAVEVGSTSSIFSSLDLFWNLHTIIASCPHNNESIVPTEIWKMCQLRHIEFLVSWVCLSDPPDVMDENTVIMENLQVLKGVKNFKCSKEVVKRIPNIKKLKTRYFGFHNDDFYYVSNIESLSKLEHLHIACDRSTREAPYLYKLSFPYSLKSLSLVMNIEFEWEEMVQKIGSLPHLEKLKLYIVCFGSGKWEMVEGQFPKLKHLGLFVVPGLKQWRVEDSSILPRLEQLNLYHIEELEDFPSEIGNITTLQTVWLTRCNESTVRSAKVMVDEQVDLQGDQLPFHVHVRLPNKNQELQNLSTPNFTVV